MKVLILSESDIRGGAPRAAYRLHQGLLAAGIDSQMLVQNKLGDDNTVIAPKSKVQRGIAAIKPTLDQLPFALYRNRDSSINIYSSQWLPNKIVDKIEQIKPDIVNIHWVCGGFMPIEALPKLKQPLVWTLHDMWPFTGGCHYSRKCDRYTKSCGVCPQLQSNTEWDLSKWVWQRKARAWQDLNLTIVTPSQWLAQCTSSSSLFQCLRIEVIPNGLDTQRYKPIDKQLAKNLIGLPPDKQIILFGAVSATSAPRKGFHLLVSALQKLSHSQGNDQVDLVIFGSSQPSKPPDFGFKVHYLGKLKDDISLALLYAAADVFVAPSVQDNLPNTVMEALACGTPCVAFNIGGMPDMIDHKQNGYLAQPFVTEDFAQGIQWILEDQKRYFQLVQQATIKVKKNFTLEIQAERYCQVFASLLDN